MTVGVASDLHSVTEDRDHSLQWQAPV